MRIAISKRLATENWPEAADWRDEAAAILGPAGFSPVLTFGDAQGAIQSVAIEGQPPVVNQTYRRGTVVEFTAL